MPFNDRLVSLQTPPRVYALCRLAEYRPYTKKQLQQLLQPEGSGKSFPDVFSFAQNGKLISETPDGFIECRLTAEELSSPARFRWAVNQRAFARPELMFCRFTAWYLARGAKVYGEPAQLLAAAFDQEINVGRDLNIYNDENVRGWRTWAAFLGFGFLHRGRTSTGFQDVLIPNVAVRLSDALEDSLDLPRGRPVPFGEFMAWLARVCPELDGGPIAKANRGSEGANDQHLTVGLSAGLRALHDAGTVELHHTRDSRDNWFLDPAPLHRIPEQVSEIVIKG